MRAIDTNILVRYLVRDDVVQAGQAEAILSTACFLPLTVLLETVWLLASRYSLSRSQIAQALQEVLKLSSVATQDDAVVAWAIERFGAGADFADMIHLLSAHSASSFVTFDRKLARLAGAGAPLPIETLA